MMLKWKSVPGGAVVLTAWIGGMASMGARAEAPPALAEPASRSAPARWCGSRPEGEVRVFVEDAGDSVSVHFRGTPGPRRPPDALGLERLEVRDVAGRTRRLAFGAPRGHLPLREGETYGFQVDFDGEVPHACGILIWDRRGLLFAATTDVRPAATVLKDGVPGFAVSLAPPRCPSRPHDECFTAICNTTIDVVHGRASATLHHGESVMLGHYRASCLTAQVAVYSPRCADAAVPGVSYILERVR